MENDQFKDLIYAYALGCLDEDSKVKLIEHFNSVESIEWEELGQLQNLTSLLPLLLERENPGIQLKDKIARKFYELREEIKSRRQAEKKHSEEKIQEELPDEERPKEEELTETDSLEEELEIPPQEVPPPPPVEDIPNLDEDEYLEIQEPAKFNLDDFDEENIEIENIEEGSNLEEPEVSENLEIESLEDKEETEVDEKSFEEVEGFVKDEDENIIEIDESDKIEQEIPEEIEDNIIEDKTENPEEEKEAIENKKPELPKSKSDRFEVITPSEFTEDEEDFSDIKLTEEPIEEEYQSKEQKGDESLDKEKTKKEFIKEEDNQISKSPEKDESETDTSKESIRRLKFDINRENELREKSQTSIPPLPPPKKKSKFGILAVVLIVLMAALMIYFYFKFSNDVDKYQMKIESLNNEVQTLKEHSKSNDEIQKLLSSDNVNVVKLTATSTHPQGSGRLIMSFENGKGYLQLSGLPGLSPNQVYQLWMTINGKLVSLGTYNTRETKTYYPISLPAVSNPQGSRFLLTKENSPGSDSPSRDIYLTGVIE